MADRETTDHEVARLQALDRQDVLDTTPEPAFDRIADLAHTLADVPVAMVNFVDSERRWCKAFTGTPTTEIPRALSFCEIAVESNDILYVPDTTADPHYADHPLVTGPPYMRFYMGVPLRVEDGQAIGTLCVLDHVPRRLSKEQRTAIRHLASVVERELAFRQSAYTDPLTGAFNRRLFTQMVERENARTLRHGGVVSIAYLDFDHFRTINDSYGHTVGDAVLAAMARVCRRHVRAEDTLFRVGGEEFAVLFAGLGAKDAHRAAERLGTAIAEAEIDGPDGPLSLSASIGLVSCTPSPNPLSNALIAEADQAMYRAKSSGRNQVVAVEITDPADLPIAESSHTDVGEVVNQDTLAKLSNLGSEPWSPASTSDSASVGAELSTLHANAAELANLGFWVWDQQVGRTVYVSHGMAELFGLSRHAYLDGPGRADQMLSWFHPDDRATYERVWYNQALQGGAYRIDVRFFHQDGRVRHAREIGEPVFDANARLLRIVGTFQDITDAKTREIELERRIGEQEALAQIAEATLRERDPDKLSISVLQRMIAPLQADWVAILERAADGLWGPGQVLAASSAASARLHGGQQDLAELDALDAGKTVEVDLQECACPSALATSTGRPQRLLVTPVSDDPARPQALIAAYRARSDAFDETAPAFLASAAGLLATARARIEVDADRAAKQEQLAGIAENLPGLIYRRRHWADGSYTYEYMSVRARDLLGVDPLDVQRDPSRLYDRVHPDDRVKLQQALEAGATEAARNQEELRVFDADGNERVLRNTSRLTLGAGGSARVDGIAMDVTESKRAEAEAAYTFYYDQLTALPNRLSFQHALGDALERAAPGRWPVGVAVLDIDDFTRINNAYGRSVGDQLLVRVATRLCQVIRNSDTLARLSSDRFLVLFDTIRHTDDVRQLIARLREPFRTPLTIADGETIEPYKVSASIGFAVYPDDGHDPDELLANAEAALSAARAEGPGGYSFYTPEFTARTRRYLNTEHALERALEREEFTLVYQPKVGAKDLAVRGFEALIRWQHADQGLLLPGAFIDVAEETGQIVAIDRFVLRAACACLQRCASSIVTSPQLSIAVNVSARSLMHPEFIAHLDQALSDYAVPARGIQVELTENSLMRDFERANAVLTALRERGVAVAIDDFGTGYSSMKYLSELPFDSIKIAQAFVDNITEDSQRAGVIDAVVNLGRRLNKTVVAEGVETEAQRRLLADYGVDELQGFGVGKPVSEADARHML